MMALRLVPFAAFWSLDAWPLGLCTMGRGDEMEEDGSPPTTCGDDSEVDCGKDDVEGIIFDA